MAKRRCIPERVWQEVVKRDGMVCQSCGCVVRVRTRASEYADECCEIGHVVPVKEGGANTADNLVVMCQRCNRSLGARPFVRRAA